MYGFAIFCLILICIAILFKDYIAVTEGLTAFEKAMKKVKKSKIYKASGINKYLAPKKNKKKKKKSPVFDLKPAASADYSDNILPPYTGDNFELIKKDLVEYDKALDGKESTKVVSPAPIGRQYFYNTGVKCTDLETGDLVDRYSIVDSRTGTKNEEDGSIDKSIFASAIADLNQSTVFKEKPDYKQTMKDACIPITIQPINVYGKSLTPETHHVSLFDIGTYDKTQNTAPSKEGFTTLERMDFGQKTFVYSVSILGLYLFFRALK
jgi:hypothetical protein